MREWLGGICTICALLAGTGLQAEAVSLFSAGVAVRSPLYEVAPQAARTAALGANSLFIGREGSSLFADRPETAPAFADATASGMTGDAVTLVRQIIGQAESHRAGYDAVQHGARIKPRDLPTQMTVAEIYDWIKATPGQPHAIGRYQFIPQTLRRVMKKIDAAPQQRFSPQLQDRLADVLLAEAGYHEAQSGRLSRRGFMNNLAKIWAGLPNDTGKSHYEGYAGNKASMTWARFDAQMAQVFPQ